MKKLNYLTESLNKFRMEHQSKTYNREEILEILKSLGFSLAICNSILGKGYIPSERVGKAKLYSFGKDPIHKSQIESLYKSNNIRNNAYREKSHILTKEEEALELLQSKGYQIRKVKGFDVERFQKENPVLYKKYLIYETV